MTDFTPDAPIRWTDHAPQKHADYASFTLIIPATPTLPLAP